MFEAIGAGGVVCTSRFEEMEHFFEYGREIVEFEDADDLVAVLDEILGDPGRLEAIRRAAFQRLVDEHLYEHRWLNLFSDIEDDLEASEDGILTRERAAVVSETLAGDGRGPRKVVISGFYGARNLGDDLLLQSISEGLRERSRGPLAISIAAHNAERVRELGLEAFPRRDLDQARDEMADGSAVVLGGGGLWHDHTFEKAGGVAGWFQGNHLSVTGLGILPIMARVFERQFHVFGMGVGPLDDPDAQAVVRFIAEQADSITVRDETSAQLLAQISDGRLAVSTMPDPVYGLRLPERRLPDEVRRLRAGWRLVAVNLRPWPKAETEGTYDAVAETLARLAAEGDVAFVGVSMQAGDRVDDAAIRATFERLGTTAPTVILPWESPVEEVLGTLEAADALLSMRLHASLLAHRLGVPAVGLAYDPKVSEHYAELGLAHRCLTLGAQPEEMTAALTAALALGGVLEPEVADRVTALTSRASEALDALAAHLDDAPPIRLPEDGRDWLVPGPDPQPEP